MRKQLSLLLLLVCSPVALAKEPRTTVQVQVDAAKAQGELAPIWRFFGADEPNYAYLPQGQKLLGELGALRPEQVYFRAHNLLCTGDGTPALKWGSTNAYQEVAGQPVYDWTIIDRIFAAYRTHQVRPYVQIGFMPRDLSVQPDPYQHQWTPQVKYDEIYTGWAHPPRDYQKWQELVYQWARHAVEKYGAAEVEQWYWQVWNEPNIGYWQGTREEFLKLHDHALAGVRRALPTARVGGPDFAGSGGDWMTTFLDHSLRGKNFATGEIGTPLDFVSFHAKGRPEFIDGHVRLGIADQLRTIDDGFRRIAHYPELRNTPIVIGESDPDGCAACQGAHLGYRNSSLYASYTAASFARKWELAARHGVRLEGALTWAFEFEDTPLFAGFRVLSSGGVPHPVLNTFRLFARLPTERVEAMSDAQRSLDDIMKDGVRGAADIGVIAARKGQKLSILVWHYHDDDVPGPPAEVSLSVRGLMAQEKPRAVRQFLVDKNHSNAYTKWQEQGSPAKPTPDQFAELIRSSELAEVAAPEMTNEGEQLVVKFALERQGITLVEIE